MKKRIDSKKRDQSKSAPGGSFAKLSAALAEIARGFYARGWVLGTSGNFSAVVSHKPLRIAITSSGLDKGVLTAAHFLEVDESGHVVRGNGRPSAETLIHLAIVRSLGAGAVLHTHSVSSTLLSQRHSLAGGIAIEGFEMLKGLEGVATHQHREWLPIVENSQDMAELSAAITAALERNPSVHGILLRGHGLYTWGKGLEEAKRHVEIIEFLLEVLARAGAMPQTNAPAGAD